MTKILLALLIVISVPVLLGAAQEAYGANINLIDNVENQITLQASQFELRITQPVAAGTGLGITVPGETITFEGGWLVNRGGNPDPGRGIIFFTDSNGDVSDIVTASWRTDVRFGFDRSRITLSLQSSPNCENLGSLPDGFTGFPEPTGGFAQIQGSFVDPSDPTRRVGIPTNLVINFIASRDINCPEIVDIDIKPGSVPSSVSCKTTKGGVPVAIFGSDTFDVSTIDLTTLQLNGVPVTEVHNKIHIEDKNGDEFPDAVLHLNKAGVCEATSDDKKYPLKKSKEATLTGSNADGDFTGIGDIRIVKR